MAYHCAQTALLPSNTIVSFCPSIPGPSSSTIISPNNSIFRLVFTCTVFGGTILYLISKLPAAFSPLTVMMYRPVEGAIRRYSAVSLVPVTFFCQTATPSCETDNVISPPVAAREYFMNKISSWAKSTVCLSFPLNQAKEAANLPGRSLLFQFLIVVAQEASSVPASMPITIKRIIIDYVYNDKETGRNSVCIKLLFFTDPGKYWVIR